MANTKQILLVPLNSQAGGSSYAPISAEAVFNGTEGLRSQTWAATGTFSNAVIRIASARGTGNGWTFTLMINSVATAITVTITGTDTTGQDITHTAAVTAGDKVSWRATAVGSPTSIDGNIALEFDSTTGESGYGNGPIDGTAGTRYSTVFGASPSLHTTEAAATEIVPIAGTITATYLRSWDTPAAGNYIYTLIKNGVVQDGTSGTPNTSVNFAGGTTTASTTFSVSVAVGDRICYRIVMTAGNWVGQATRFVATTSGESMIGGGNNQNIGSSTQYNWLSGVPPSFAWSGTESSRYVYAGISSIQLDKLQVYLQAAPGGVTARTLSVRKNLANPIGTPNVMITGVANTGADTTNSLTVVNGDALGIMHVVTGSPASSSARWLFRVQAVATGGGGGGSSSGTITRVQATPAAGSLNPIVMSFSSPPAVGNLIVVGMVIYGVGGPAACTDNYGNTYVAAISKTNGQSLVFIYYTRVVSTGASFNITFSGYNGRGIAVELNASGQSFIVDKTSSNSGTSTTPSTGVTSELVGSNAYSFIVAACDAGLSSITVDAATPSWTQELENTSFSLAMGEIDGRILSSASGTTQSGSWTTSPSSTWAAAIVTFASTGGSGGGGSTSTETSLAYIG